MGRANVNEAITHLAMPERRIPVLMRSTQQKRQGVIHVLFYPPPSDGISIFVPANVRIVPITALEMFVTPWRGEEFEKAFGPVDEAWHKKLIYLFKLAEAIGGDGWELKKCIEEGLAGKHIRERALSDPIRELGEQFNMGIYTTVNVIWWAEHEKRFAPGLFCPDMPTALYALALTRIGEPGGLSVCLRCGKPFLRSRGTGKQSYCNYRCRSAAAMVRYRKRQVRRKKTKVHKRR